jgi:hypothetical protein
MIAPCVNILRELATSMNGMLGSDQGTKHTAPDLSGDIERLMINLDEYEVYKKLGRVFADPSDVETKDVVAEGLKALAKPLAAYNKTFERLQQRFRMRPVVTGRPGHAQPPPPLASQSPLLRPSTVEMSTQGACLGSSLHVDECQLTNLHD